VDPLIASIIEEHAQLSAILSGPEHLSIGQSLNRHFQRVLVVSAASLFEDKVKAAILTAVASAASNDERFVTLVRVKAVERQFHTLFDWEKDETGTNKFWAAFGGVLKKDSLEKQKKDPMLSNAAASFIQIGRLRNELVHGNFATQFIESTIDELKVKISAAELFVEFIKKQLS
jgi:hypothetical protein